MAISTSQQLGQARIGIEEFVKIEGERYNEMWNFCNKISTTQDFITFSQVSDFGYPQLTQEGAASVTDNKVKLYTASFTPKEFTLMFGLTWKASFTDQYGLFMSYKGDIADSFQDLDALAVANMFNNGFAATGYNGIDGVSLFNAAHPYGNYPTWNNLGTTAALAYNPVAAAMAQMRKVRTARQRPMRFRSGIRLLVPPDLEFTALALRNSIGIFDTANRADNQLKDRLVVQVDEDLSSSKSWFTLAADVKSLGLFFLNQMPIKILTNDFDARTRTMLVSIFKSFITGWKHALRVQGNLGA